MPFVRSPKVVSNISVENNNKRPDFFFFFFACSTDRLLGNTVSIEKFGAVTCKVRYTEDKGVLSRFHSGKFDLQLLWVKVKWARL